MTRRAVSWAATVSGPIRAAFADIRAEFEVRDAFEAPVLAEAHAVSANAQPEHDRADDTDVAFVTIDPPGSLDLDQAVHIEENAHGCRVRYAIADVPAFVRPGGPMDIETRRRGLTLYLPDGRAPLHPLCLSEGAASLLPGQDRPAFVWDMIVDSAGQVRSARVYRSRVRSRARYTYEQVQQAHDQGRSVPSLAGLAAVGQARAELGLARGAASLPMPEQQISQESGRYVVGFRPVLPAEEWNAHISLLTGTVAAGLMLDGGVGIVRTMPPATPEAITRLRREAHALQVPWPDEEAPGHFLARLDREDPTHLALIYEATSLFRGASYTRLRRPATQGGYARSSRGALCARHRSAAPAGGSVWAAGVRGHQRRHRCR